MHTVCARVHVSLIMDFTTKMGNSFIQSSVVVVFFVRWAVASHRSIDRYINEVKVDAKNYGANRFQSIIYGVHYFIRYSVHDD